MVQCDVFELNCGFHQDGGQRIIRYHLRTDLPVGTRVLISLERYYYNLLNEKCVWSGTGDEFVDEAFLEFCEHGDLAGLNGEINIDIFDAAALEEFQAIIGSMSSGIASPVSNDARLIVTVGARQRIRDFGRNNANLEGVMVQNRGGINVVESDFVFEAPMLKVFDPYVNDDE